MEANISAGGEEYEIIALPKFEPGSIRARLADILEDDTEERLVEMVEEIKGQGIRREEAGRNKTTLDEIRIQAERDQKVKKELLASLSTLTHFCEEWGRSNELTEDMKKAFREKMIDICEAVIVYELVIKQTMHIDEIEHAPEVKKCMAVLDYLVPGEKEAHLKKLVDKARMLKSSGETAWRVHDEYKREFFERWGAFAHEQQMRKWIEQEKKRAKKQRQAQKEG